MVDSRLNSGLSSSSPPHFLVPDELGISGFKLLLALVPYGDLPVALDRRSKRLTGLGTGVMQPHLVLPVICPCSDGCDSSLGVSG